MVPSFNKIVLSVFLTIGVCSSVVAQQEHHPSVVVGHRGVGTLKEDLKFLLDLTSPTEQKQLDNVVSFIELMLFGVDEDRPMRVDILTGTIPPTSIIWGGYKILDELQEDNLGAQFQLKKEAENLFKLLDEPGWFRVLPDQKFGILSIAQDAKDLPLLKQIIQKQVDPMPEIEPLLLNGANVGISLSNKAVTPEDQTKRRDSFAEIRANKLDALQKRPSESETAFDLRKGIVTNQLSELERLMVESLRASARIFLDKVNGSARVEFDSEGIEGTSLAGSLALFGQKPDAFHSIKKLDSSVLSLRANHPLDELRQKNALSNIELMRKDTAALLKADTKMTDQEKEASQQLFDGIAAVTIDGISSGYVNGFLESTVDKDGEFVSISAVSVVDGKRLDETLALIAKTGNGNKVTMNMAEAGDVKIHEIRLAKGFFQPFDDIFGAEKSVYIGTSDKIVWIGIGNESLESLKKVVADLKEPEMNDVILKINGNVLPWAKRALDLVKKTNPTAIAEQEKRRDRMRSLELAVESLTSKDDASFELKVQDGKGTGVIFVNTGILKYLGRELSFYSKTTLQ